MPHLGFATCDPRHLTMVGRRVLAEALHRIDFSAEVAGSVRWPVVLGTVREVVFALVDTHVHAPSRDLVADAARALAPALSVAEVDACVLLVTDPIRVSEAGEIVRGCERVRAILDGCGESLAVPVLRG